MKFAIALLSLTFALNASAKSLTCTASLRSSIEDDKSFVKAMQWMEENKVTDESLIPKELLGGPVKVDVRSAKIDEEGNADLGGIIVESYEKHGISLNYHAYARNGFITSAGIENEVTHNGSGVSGLKNQTEVEFSSSSLVDGSWLELACEIK